MAWLNGVPSWAALASATTAKSRSCTVSSSANWQFADHHLCQAVAGAVHVAQEPADACGVAEAAARSAAVGCYWCSISAGRTQAPFFAWASPRWNRAQHGWSAVEGAMPCVGYAPQPRGGAWSASARGADSEPDRVRQMHEVQVMGEHGRARRRQVPVPDCSGTEQADSAHGNCREYAGHLPGGSRSTTPA